MERYSALGLSLTVSIAFSIYYGIKRTKNWTVLTVLVFSYASIIIAIVQIVGYDGNIVEKIFHNLFGFLRVLFDAYVIYIFTKNETRKYFRYSGSSFIT